MSLREKLDYSVERIADCMNESSAQLRTCGNSVSIAQYHIGRRDAYKHALRILDSLYDELGITSSAAGPRGGT